MNTKHLVNAEPTREIVNDRLYDVYNSPEMERALLMLVAGLITPLQYADQLQNMINAANIMQEVTLQ